MGSICLSDCFKFLVFRGLLWNMKHALIIQFTSAPSLSDATTEAKTLIAGLDKPIVIWKWKVGGEGKFLRGNSEEFNTSLKDKHWVWEKT